MSDPFMDQFAAVTVPALLSLHGRSGTYRPNGDAGEDKTIDVVLVAGSEEPLIADGNTTMDRDTIEVEISSRSDTEGHIAPTIPGRGVPDKMVIDGTTYTVLDLLIDGRFGTGIHRLKLCTKNTPYADAR